MNQDNPWYLKRVIKSPPTSGSAWMTLGNFDGCHLGHQKLFTLTHEKSPQRSIAVTFYPHPSHVFGSHPVPCLDTLEERIQKILHLDISEVWVIHFTPEFAKTPWDMFLKKLATDLGHPLKGVCIGEDFSFGHKREGSPTHLKKWLSEQGAECIIVPPVMANEKRISSGWARELILDGNITFLRETLNCRYLIPGVVQRGRQLGRTLGFPTANLFPNDNQILPPHGVYVASTHLKEKIYPSVVNIGIRPTLEENPSLLIESHLLDFDAMIYGETIKVELQLRLRGEIKFPDLDALKTQIAKDAHAARHFFNTSGQT